uniref:Uncharacterized protein n=1 Tax=Noctiluca scintillans TaxID=2966 RepID=A0A7S1FHQ4_NOCSC
MLRHRPLFALPPRAESQFRFGEDSAHGFATAVRASGTLASLEVSPTSGTLISARCRLAPRLPQHLASLARHLGASNPLGKLPARSAAVVTRGFALQLNAPSPANIAWRFAKPRTVQAVAMTSAIEGTLL